MMDKREFDKMFQYAAEKEKNKWLIHIKTEIVEPGLVFDISEHKIYYDSAEGNYRRKLQCECGAELGCFCFRSMQTAIESVDCTLVICNRCYLKEPDIQETDFVQSIMHDLYPDKTVDQMNDIEIEVIMRFCSEQHNDEFDVTGVEVCGI